MKISPTFVVRGFQELPDSFGETGDFTAASASLDAQDYLQARCRRALESVLCR